MPVEGKQNRKMVDTPAPEANDPLSEWVSQVFGHKDDLLTMNSFVGLLKRIALGPLNNTIKADNIVPFGDITLEVPIFPAGGGFQLVNGRKGSCSIGNTTDVIITATMYVDNKDGSESHQLGNPIDIAPNNDTVLVWYGGYNMIKFTVKPKAGNPTLGGISGRMFSG